MGFDSLERVALLTAVESEFTTQFLPESVLVRIYLVYQVRNKSYLNVDGADLEDIVRQVTRDWCDEFAALAIEQGFEAQSTEIKSTDIQSTYIKSTDIKSTDTKSTVAQGAALARRFDSILSPMAAMASCLGPMKMMPCSSQRLAKSSFSLKKP